MIPLQTDRLALRPLRLDDEEIPYLPDHRIPGNVEDDRRLGIGCMVVALRETGEAIGQIGFQIKLLEHSVIDRECRPDGSYDAFGEWSGLPIDELQHRNDSQGSALNTPEVDIYWFFDERHWGKGYATEAAQCMIDYAFTRLHLRRVTAANIEVENTRSVRLAERIGMDVRPVPYAPSRVTGIIENPATK